MRTGYSFAPSTMTVLLISLFAVAVLAVVPGGPLNKTATGLINQSKESIGLIDEVGNRFGLDLGGAAGEDGDEDDSSTPGEVCPSTCRADIALTSSVRDAGAREAHLSFGDTGNYRLIPLLDDDVGTTTFWATEVTGISRGCAVWLHRDLEDGSDWYPAAPEDSSNVRKIVEDWSGLMQAKFAMVAPSEVSCREEERNIRYKVLAERNDAVAGGGTFHIHTIFSTMWEGARDYRITLQDRGCVMEEDTGWTTWRGDAWWWKGWKVDDPDGDGKHQPFQISVWNRDYSETEPQFTYIGCQPDGADCPDPSQLGYGKVWCTASEGEDGPSVRFWDFTINSANIYQNGHKDATSKSDVKAKVSLVNGDDAETSTKWDNLAPVWDATLFAGKPIESLTTITINIDDYDHGSWDDDIGECDFNINRGAFEEGEVFTRTESCGDVFDVTFTIRPAE